MDKLAILQILGTYIFMFSLKFLYGDTMNSCSQTPYPDVCNHYMGTVFLQTLDLDQTQFSFQDLSTKITMNQAIRTHNLIAAMDLTSFQESAKLAWSDCLELYHDTVHHLNRSISSSNNPTDTLTWLSAAIANEQTCQNGFSDFNLTSYLHSLPLMIGNFSKLLSNSLALKQAEIASLQYATEKDRRRRLLHFSDEFPSWVPGADRKLLRSGGRVTNKGDIVVAQDGSGDYKTINEAVAASVKLRKRTGIKRIVIYVKKGVYRENIEIKKSMKNLMFIGDGIDATIVTSNRNVKDGFTTYRSATFAVSGSGFIARDMTFENTAGPGKHQAVALRSSSDFSVFYRCSFKGYQDTLYAHSLRQFYRECDIHGTLDFIFGDSAAIFQNCNIYIRNPMNNQKNTVTAQGRKDPNQNTGIIIQNSRIMPAPEMKIRVHDDTSSFIKSYLGRPWKMYSRTVFMKCYIDGLIAPEGWLEWNGDFALDTLYYGEFMNTGIGASTVGRVKWPGYHVIRNPTEAGMFTVGNFLGGDSWIPASGVPFENGL